MKKVTRFFSLLLAIAMVLAMNFGTLTVSAADTYTITISNASTGHTYTAYQIFTGDVSGTTLSNVQWGSDVVADEVVEALYNASILSSSSYSSAQAVADALADLKLANASTIASAIVDNKDDTLKTSNTYVTASGTTAEISGLASGYYLVIDTYDTLGTEIDDVYSAYIVEIVGASETVYTKQDKPTVDKGVKNTNDTSGAVTDYQAEADYDIGDTIPYQISAKLGTAGSNFLDYYDEYSITFTDTLSAGLTFVEITDVYVADTNGDKTYSIYSDNYSTNCTSYVNAENTLTVEFTDILTLKQTNGTTDNPVDEGYYIVVEYTATLNSYAKIGTEEGNPNEVYLTYSNNPNGTEEGKTSTVKAIVYTYKLTVSKTDGTDPLSGADFDLLKKLSGEPSGTKAYLPANPSDGDYRDYTKYTESSTSATGDYYFAIGDVIYFYDSTEGAYYELKLLDTTSTATSFVFTGLDDGTYKLKEMETPPGYNSIEPIVFQIVSTYDDTTGELEKVEVKDSSGNVISGANGSFSADTNYNLSTTVVNSSGAVMPETGGMGTKIFYTLGGVLVLGAGVLLIVKRRMRNA